MPADLRQLIAASAAGTRRQAPRRLQVLLRDMAKYFGLAAIVALQAARGTDAVLVNVVAPLGEEIIDVLGA